MSWKVGDLVGRRTSLDLLFDQLEGGGNPLLVFALNRVGNRVELAELNLGDEDEVSP